MPIFLESRAARTFPQPPAKKHCLLPPLSAYCTQRQQPTTKAATAKMVTTSILETRTAAKTPRPPPLTCRRRPAHLACAYAWKRLRLSTSPWQTRPDATDIREVPLTLSEFKKIMLKSQVPTEGTGGATRGRRRHHAPVSTAQQGDVKV